MMGIKQRLIDVLTDRISDKILASEKMFRLRRRQAIYEIWGYLKDAKISGDYAEFGVASGKVFRIVLSILGNTFPEMRFFAFDSFQGLPELREADLLTNYNSFYKGQYAYNEKYFYNSVLNSESKQFIDRVIIIPCWFDNLKNINNGLSIKQNLSKLSFVWIDCDLYESTVPVLEFITPYIGDGTVIAFDDWRCFRNRSDYGQQRACNEWQRKTNVKLNFLVNIGWNGSVFTVEEKL